MKKIIIILIMLSISISAEAFVYNSRWAYGIDFGIDIPKTGSSFPNVGLNIKYGVKEKIYVTSSVDFGYRDFNFDKPNITADLKCKEIMLAIGAEYIIYEKYFLNMNVFGKLTYNHMQIDEFNDSIRNYRVDSDMTVGWNFGVRGEYMVNRNWILGADLGVNIGNEFEFLADNPSFKRPFTIDNTNIGFKITVNYLPPAM